MPPSPLAEPFDALQHTRVVNYACLHCPFSTNSKYFKGNKPAKIDLNVILFELGKLRFLRLFFFNSNLIQLIINISSRAGRGDVMSYLKRHIFYS